MCFMPNAFIVAEKLWKKWLQGLAGCSSCAGWWERRKACTEWAARVVRGAEDAAG